MAFHSLEQRPALALKYYREHPSVLSRGRALAQQCTSHLDTHVVVSMSEHVECLPVHCYIALRHTMEHSQVFINTVHLLLPTRLFIAFFVKALNIPSLRKKKESSLTFGPAVLSKHAFPLHILMGPGDPTGGHTVSSTQRGQVLQGLPTRAPHAPLATGRVCLPAGAEHCPAISVLLAKAVTPFPFTPLLQHVVAKGVLPGSRLV